MIKAQGDHLVHLTGGRTLGLCPTAMQLKWLDRDWNQHVHYTDIRGTKYTMHVYTAAVVFLSPKFQSILPYG